MLERAKKGLGLTTKRLDIISYAQEDLLWEKGLLGDQEPKAFHGIFDWDKLCIAQR